jgi:DNA polymerase-3 subunit epsilon
MLTVYCAGGSIDRKSNPDQNNRRVTSKYLLKEHRSRRRMTSPVRANRYEASCVECGLTVAPEAGVLLRSRSGSWVVYHPHHAPEAGPGGVTADVSAMRPNQRDGDCEVCGVLVPAGHGVLMFTQFGGWEVYHREHVREPSPPPRGTHTGWHRRHLMAVDIATTGNRYTVDRIIGAAVHTTDGTSRYWLIDPGPGPLSVTPHKTHGITLEKAHAEGVPASEALDELATVLADHLMTKEPLVAWHAPFVLTTLEVELLRHGLISLADRTPNGPSPICDPLVLDRHADPFRSGGRALKTVTAWYGVPHRPGHPCHDAEAALVLAYIIGACYPPIGRLSRPALHREQVRWHQEQVQNAEALNRNGEREPHWPLGTVKLLPWQDHGDE